MSDVPVRASIVIIGGGPAGVAAAVEACREGGDVVLVDAGARLGGQYWRHARRHEEEGSTRWHHGWSTFRRLAGEVQEAESAGRLRYLPSMQVWALDAGDDGFVVRVVPVPESTSHPRRGRTIEARQVILCPGTYDRQVPIPGWDLPGVMAAGGIQAFVKTQETVPGRRVVLAGTGPFLLAAAATVVEAGAQVVAVCESSSPRAWLPDGAVATLVPGKVAEGAGYAVLMARHRVPYLTRHAVIRIHGEEAATGVTISRVDAAGRPVAGSERRLGADLVGLGWGFVPQPELALQVDADMRLDVDGSLVGAVDDLQRSSVPGLYLAGEITGVTGAVGAVAEGRIAGRSAASRIRGGRPGGRAHELDRLTRARHRRFARAMHGAHPVPAGWREWLDDDTVICRCEEVPYSAVRTAQEELSLNDARSVKGSTRVGMGVCQGRMCGFAASGLSAGLASTTVGAGVGKRQETPAEVGSSSSVGRRPIVAPVELGAIAEESGRGSAL